MRLSKGQIFAVEALATVVLLAVALAFSVKVYEVDKSNWERYQPVSSKAREGALQSIYSADYRDRYFPDKNELYCDPFYGYGLPAREGNISPNDRVFCSFFGDGFCLNNVCEDGQGGRPDYGENCKTCKEDCPCPGGQSCCGQACCANGQCTEGNCCPAGQHACPGGVCVGDAECTDTRPCLPGFTCTGHTECDQGECVDTCNSPITPTCNYPGGAPPGLENCDNCPSDCVCLEGVAGCCVGCSGAGADGCCPDDYTKCSSTCCLNGNCCGVNCCASPAACCNGNCCSATQTCCESTTCCDSSQVCVSGQACCAECDDDGDCGDAEYCEGAGTCSGTCASTCNTPGHEECENGQGGNPDYGETCSNCPQDCGSCANCNNNGTCEGGDGGASCGGSDGETCTVCAPDCCPGTSEVGYDVCSNGRGSNEHAGSGCTNPVDCCGGYVTAHIHDLTTDGSTLSNVTALEVKYETGGGCCQSQTVRAFYSTDATTWTEFPSGGVLPATSVTCCQDGDPDPDCDPSGSAQRRRPRVSYQFAAPGISVQYVKVTSSHYIDWSEARAFR